MGAPRRGNPISRRRRQHDDDGEDEGSLAAAGIEDDSSQASLASELDEDADAEGSDASDRAAAHPKKNGSLRQQQQQGEPFAPVSGNVIAAEPAGIGKTTSGFSAAVADTEAMMNGMNIKDAAGAVGEVDFENTVSPAQTSPRAAPAGAGRMETLAERRRREHEEYKKRRDADPAFVPNRGGFFMHDQRSSMTGQNGFRSAARGGRGRGRPPAGPFSPLG